MRRTQLVTVVVLSLITLIFAYGQSPAPSPQTGQTATRTERRQPVKAKKILVKELPQGLEGIALEKGLFKLKPGYKFVPQPNGAVAVALQVGGGRGVGGTYNCQCFAIGGGNESGCEPDTTTTKGSLTCVKSKETPCDGYCVLQVSTTGPKTKLAIF